MTGFLPADCHVITIAEPVCQAVMSPREYEALVTLLVVADTAARLSAAIPGNDDPEAHVALRDAADALRLAFRRLEWTIREEAERRAKGEKR